VKLLYDLDHRVGKIPADSRQVYQALLNLFANAEEAMPRGGEIRVSTRLSPARDRAVVLVRDTGEGIPLATRKRIFDRFFTTKESGLGLGLSVVKQVMGAHGGEVTVEPDPEGGTVFALRFPRGEHHADADYEEREPHTHAPNSRGR
jgi:signal transduction histidine kinase